MKNSLNDTELAKIRRNAIGTLRMVEDLRIAVGEMQEHERALATRDERARRSKRTPAKMTSS